MSNVGSWTERSRLRRASKRAVGRVVVGVEALTLFVTASIAFAGPSQAASFVVPGPNFPSTVNVGQPFAARLGLANHSTPPESTTYPTLTVGAIDLVPSCADAAPGCAGGVASGVFGLSSTGTGVSGPQSCQGTWTIAEPTPGVFRFRPPGGENTLALPTGAVCLVDFTATALRIPNPSQTAQVASATFSAPGLNPMRISGYDQATVLSPPPTTTTTRPPTTTTTTTTRPPTTTTTTRPPTPPTPSPVALVAAHSGMVMHAPAAVGAQVVQSRWSGAANQQWLLLPLGGDVHVIVSVGSGQVLTVAGASTANGAPIVQTAWTGAVNQWWRAIPFSALAPGGSPDYYLLVSAHSGRVVDVAGASTADGAPLVQWPWAGSANQVWVKVDL